MEQKRGYAQRTVNPTTAKTRLRVNGTLGLEAMSQTRRYVPRYFAEARLLPNGFKYPASYIAFAASGRGHVGPVNEDWIVLEASQIEKFFGYVKAVSPGKALVPFMRVNGDDGVACFDADSVSEDPFVYVCNVFHNFGCWGTQRTFPEWLSQIRGR